MERPNRKERDGLDRCQREGWDANSQTHQTGEWRTDSTTCNTLPEDWNVEQKQSSVAQKQVPTVYIHGSGDDGRYLAHLALRPSRVRAARRRLPQGPARKKTKKPTGRQL